MCGSAPKTPDPNVVSAAQTKSNKDTAAYNASLNRINQSSPFGSISYSQTGTDPTTGAPMYSQSTQLSPQLQSLLNSQIGAQQGISGAISNQIGNLPTGAFNPNIDVGNIQQNSFDSQMAQLQPQFDQGAKSLEGTLSDRGIPIGSEIWNDQTGNYNRAKDTSILGASRQAQQDATNEAQRQFSNQYQQYMSPYQQLSSLMGNSQSVSNPSFSSFAQSSAAPTNTAQNTWNAYQADVAANNASNANWANGALGIGKLALMAL
ncbi:MAG: hypothetical protein RIQ68_504 [Pseudomonadota bacterium]|jgi:hypothetical protein